MTGLRRTVLSVHLADCAWWPWMIKQVGKKAARKVTADLERAKLTGGPVTAKTPVPRGWG